MNLEWLQKSTFWRAVGAAVAAALFAATLAVAEAQDRGVFVLTSTNNPSGNSVEVFKLDTSGTPSLSLVNSLSTGGKAALTPTQEFCSFRTISALSQISAPTP